MNEYGFTAQYLNNVYHREESAFLHHFFTLQFFPVISDLEILTSSRNNTKMLRKTHNSDIAFSTRFNYIHVKFNQKQDERCVSNTFKTGIGKYLPPPSVFRIQNLRLVTLYSKNAFGWYFGLFHHQIVVLVTEECISFPYAIMLV